MQKTDWSLSAVIAGFVAVLVGYASSIVIIVQAANASGANAEVTASWIGILGFTMGATCIAFSWFYKMPILTAWSTPGAALLVTSLNDVSLSETVGVFMFAAALTILVGFSGLFDRIKKLIPLPISSAMLAGILFQFGVDVFNSLLSSPILVLTLLLTFLLSKRFAPRYALILVLFTGIIFCRYYFNLDFSNVNFEIVELIWTNPKWSISSILGVGIPLFIVTMTSQNIPGLAVLNAHSYDAPISPLLKNMGILTFFTAPFGNFSINLAAITASICCGQEAHLDQNKRYIAGISAGFFYILTGLAGSTIVALISILPHQFVAVIAGLALLGTIAMTLARVTEEGVYRDPAMLTFLMTASGFSFFGIASAFWGLLVGLLAAGILNYRKEKL